MGSQPETALPARSEDVTAEETEEPAAEPETPAAGQE